MIRSLLFAMMAVTLLLRMPATSDLVACFCAHQVISVHVVDDCACDHDGATSPEGASEEQLGDRGSADDCACIEIRIGSDLHPSLIASIPVPQSAVVADVPPSWRDIVIASARPKPLLAQLPRPPPRVDQTLARLATVRLTI